MDPWQWALLAITMMSEDVGSMCGSSICVNMKWPKWLVRSWRSTCGFPGDSCFSSAITPPLLTKMTGCLPPCTLSLTKARMDRALVRSNVLHTILRCISRQCCRRAAGDPALSTSRHRRKRSSRVFSHRLRLRQAMTTSSAPAFTNSLTNSAPIPEDAPVTIQRPEICEVGAVRGPRKALSERRRTPRMPRRPTVTRPTASHDLAFTIKATMSMRAALRVR